MYKTLPKREALRKLFEILNAVQLDSSKQLTDTEIRLLVEFLCLPNKKFEYQRFSSLAKTKVIQTAEEELDWVLSRENVNNKIYSMLDKGYLWRDEDSVIYLAKHIDALTKKLNHVYDSNTPFEFNIIFDNPDKHASENTK